LHKEKYLLQLIVWKIKKILAKKSVSGKEAVKNVKQ